MAGRQERKMEKNVEGRRSQRPEMPTMSVLCWFSKTLRRAFLNHAELLESSYWVAGLCLERLWVVDGLNFPFFFPKVLSTLATTPVPSPLVSRGGITVLHRRIKCNQASWGGGGDFFKSVFIYSHVSLSPRSVSSSLSLSGDGISECHTELCIHQHQETLVFF